MNTNKDYGRDLCKSHSARSEKEFCRVCPSKLNKKELENVYFTLLENNLDLKTTINSQREKIKILSTKIQRLTTLQKTYLGKEPKECCGSKAVIDEQKECIVELKRSNQCLTERVRQLNMRLCSAKQFLKRSPFQSTSRCNRCSNKNVSMSALVSKRSETNLRVTAASSQCLVKDVTSSIAADSAIISLEKGVQYDFCDENKCRSRIEELKIKNDDLQDELTRTKDKYASVIAQLERDMCDLRAENVRVRSERALAADRLEQLQVQLAEVTGRLSGADLRCDELSVELAVERRRAAERAAERRAAALSGRVARALDAHLAAVQTVREHTDVFSDAAGVHEKSTADDDKFLAVQSTPYKPKAAVRTKIPQKVSVPADDAFKSSDDSGYTEVNKSQEIDDTKASTYINQVLLEKIADLQNQVNNLKSFKNSCSYPKDLMKENQEINAEKTQMDVSIVSESSDSVITEKKANSSRAAIKLNISDKNDNIDSLENSFALAKTVNEVTTVADIHSADTIFEKQESDFNVDTKVRENLIGFKKRSKEIEISTDNRKLSLQSSEYYLKKRNVTKTGSLDDNRIGNIVSTEKDVKKPIDINKGSNEKYKPEEDIVAKMEEKDKNIPYSRYAEVDQTQIPIEATVGNERDNINNCAKKEKTKDSDSSKGTYTIHKEEDIALKTKPKDDSVNVNDGKKKTNDSITRHQDPYILAVDIKNKLISAATKNNIPFQPSCTTYHRGRRRSAASELRTYVKVPNDASPDGTDCEISSMSDLPSERDERTEYSRSPGEERARTASDSLTATPTTTDYGSLSEGELPLLRHTAVLSDGEKRPSNRMEKSYSVPERGARARAAAERELARCGRALRSHARLAHDSPAIN